MPPQYYAGAQAYAEPQSHYHAYQQHPDYAQPQAQPPLPAGDAEEAQPVAPGMEPEQQQQVCTQPRLAKTWCCVACPSVMRTRRTASDRLLGGQLPAAAQAVQQAAPQATAGPPEQAAQAYHGWHQQPAYQQWQGESAGAAVCYLMLSTSRCCCLTSLLCRLWAASLEPACLQRSASGSISVPWGRPQLQQRLRGTHHASPCSACW